MKQKNERTFKGTSYKGLQASETAKTKSNNSGLNCQVDVYQDIDEIVKHAWGNVKSKKYVEYSTYKDYPFATNNKDNKAVKIRFANGLQAVHIPMNNLHEQSGINRYKGQTYFPQLDRRRNNDSITTFAKNCEKAYKDAVKLGLL